MQVIVSNITTPRRPVSVVSKPFFRRNLFGERDFLNSQDEETRYILHELENFCNYALMRQRRWNDIEFVFADAMEYDRYFPYVQKVKRYCQPFGNVRLDISEIIDGDDCDFYRIRTVDSDGEDMYSITFRLLTLEEMAADEKAPAGDARAENQ